MKRPYFNIEQRNSIRLNTLLGSCCEFHLQVKKIERKISKSLFIKSLDRFVLWLSLKLN